MSKELIRVLRVISMIVIVMVICITSVTSTYATEPAEENTSSEEITSSVEVEVQSTVSSEEVSSVDEVVEEDSTQIAVMGEEPKSVVESVMSTEGVASLELYDDDGNISKPEIGDADVPVAISGADSLDSMQVEESEEAGDDVAAVRPPEPRVEISSTEEESVEISDKMSLQAKISSLLGVVIVGFLVAMVYYSSPKNDDSKKEEEYEVEGENEEEKELIYKKEEEYDK